MNALASFGGVHVGDSEKPTNTGPLADLDTVLQRLRAQEVAEFRAAASQRESLLSGWSQVAPLLNDAVGRVNAVLTKHGYRGIEMAAPQFNQSTRDSYGAEGRIPGVNSADLLVVLSADMVLYLNANCGGHCSEGHKVPLQGATVDAISDALAEIARWLIAEEPG
jgi:hypothetical protein